MLCTAGLFLNYLRSKLHLGRLASERYGACLQYIVRLLSAVSVAKVLSPLSDAIFVKQLHSEFFFDKI